MSHSVVMLHGYQIESDINLHLPVVDRSAADPLPSLRLRLGRTRTIPWEPATGEGLVRIEDRQRRVFYAITRQSDHLTIRFYGACEFRCDLGVRNVEATLDPGIDEAVLPVLVTGTLLAVRLLVDGNLVLHASAVDVAGRALAFVGASGMGKSTMATLMCAAGNALLTDDVLRVSLSQGAALAWPGAAETRLRKSADELLTQFSAPARARTTGDGRTAITAPATTQRPVPLSACVIPLPTRDSAYLLVRRLSPTEALAGLLRFPRVLGWTDMDTTARQFDQLATFVQQVPVVEVRLPWGPPFRRSLAQELVAAVM